MVPAFIGKAEITTDAAVVDGILTDYPKKYHDERHPRAEPRES